MPPSVVIGRGNNRGGSSRSLKGFLVNNPVSLLCDFVLEKSADEPVRRRLVLYRALATIVPVPAKCRELASLAAELEAIETRHNQLLLDLRQGGAK
jgi:hypothetical protein